MKATKELARELAEVSTLLRNQISDEPFTGLVIAYPSPRKNGSLNSSTAIDYEITGTGDLLTPDIRTHRGFQWLDKDPDISCARELVLQHFIEMGWPTWLTNIKVCQFYYSVASSAALAFWDSGWKPKTFSLKEKRHAVAVATELKDLLDQGILRSNVDVSQQLEGTLDYFIAVLSQPSVREYSGKTARQEYILIRLARTFVCFHYDEKERIVELVDHISAALGFSPNHRTIQRYVSKARSASFLATPWRPDNILPKTP